MIKVLFDTNIYDLLMKEENIKTAIEKLCSRGIINVLINTTIMRELTNSPCKEILDCFPHSIEDDSVFLADYSLVDTDKVGEGQVYNRHKGSSNKFKDALIADFADLEADFFVTEDKRCRSRFKNAQKGDKCRIMGFEEFKGWLIENRQDIEPIIVG